MSQSVLGWHSNLITLTLITKALPLMIECSHLAPAILESCHLQWDEEAQFYSSIDPCLQKIGTTELLRSDRAPFTSPFLIDLVKGCPRGPPRQHVQLADFVVLHTKFILTCPPLWALGLISITICLLSATGDESLFKWRLSGFYEILQLDSWLIWTTIQGFYGN